MQQIRGQYRGSTGAGATRPAGLPLAADAALVAPAPVLPKAKASTSTVLTEYQTGPRLRPTGEQL